MMGKGGGQKLEIWRQACEFAKIFATGEAQFFGLNQWTSQKRTLSASSRAASSVPSQRKTAAPTSTRPRPIPESLKGTSSAERATPKRTPKDALAASRELRKNKDQRKR